MQGFYLHNLICLYVARGQEKRNIRIVYKYMIKELEKTIGILLQIGFLYKQIWGCSSGGEHYLRTVGVRGSNPLISTIFFGRRLLNILNHEAH